MSTGDYYYCGLCGKHYIGYHTCSREEPLRYSFSYTANDQNSQIILLLQEIVEKLKQIEQKLP